MENKIFIEKKEKAFYPGVSDFFSPSEEFPEYVYSEIAQEPNHIYGMVRDCLLGLGLDKEHFGRADWNPLGELIHKGDYVVVKPNMVKHVNPKGDLKCMVTDVSIVRAIVDYVLIALGDTGKIIIGDAPVQTCNFEELLEVAGYNKLVDYYQSHGVDICVKDFRGTISERLPNGVILQKNDELARENSVLVNMGNDSAFNNKGKIENLRITNYTADDLLSHHDGSKHEYLINKDILNADVIINLPKPKTHRKAGITGALKNMVGICVEKEYLPHHTQNSVEEGGDEYPEKSWLKRTNSKLLDEINAANKNRRFFVSTLLNLVSTVIIGVKKIIDKTPSSGVREGSWSGNDTIWRTVNDLNRIVLYCDKNGKFHNTPVRKILTIADMVVFGEGEGPLAPSPRVASMIIAGKDSIALDYTIATLMGIDPNKIPCIKNADYCKKYGLYFSNPEIDSTEDSLKFDSVKNMSPLSYEHVKMPSGWTNV